MLAPFREPKSITVLALVELAVVLAGGRAALAQSLANDTYANRTPIPMNSTAKSADSNVFADIEPREPLTSNAQDGVNRCRPNGTSSGDSGARMDSTTWWDFTGTGGLVTVSTEHSSPAFYSVLAVYDADRDPFSDPAAFLICNDDIGAKGDDDNQTLSKVSLQTTRDHHYAVQVGSCESTTTSPQSCASSYSNIAVTV